MEQPISPKLSFPQRNVEYGNFAFGEYTLALRLTSELVDLRAGYANPYPCGRATRVGSCAKRISKTKKDTPKGCPSCTGICLARQGFARRNGEAGIRTHILKNQRFSGWVLARSASAKKNRTPNGVRYVRESASHGKVSLGETARQRFEPIRAVTVLVRYKSHKFPPRANIAPCLCADGFVRGAHQQKKIGTHKECLSLFW